MVFKLENWRQKIFHFKKTKNQINNFQCFISYDSLTMKERENGNTQNINTNFPPSQAFSLWITLLIRQRQWRLTFKLTTKDFSFQKNKKNQINNFQCFISYDSLTMKERENGNTQNINTNFSSPSQAFSLWLTLLIRQRQWRLTWKLMTKDFSFQKNKKFPMPH